MTRQAIIDWLLEGDVAIQYQTYRDLLREERLDLQDRIANEGWGKRFLSERNSNGHWGERFYQPKWISTHYTLLDLRNLNLKPDNPSVRETIDSVASTSMAKDGGIQLGPSTADHSDVCVNGMFLNYASYFKTDEEKLHPIVDNLLDEIMLDGGFNCRLNRSGARHSSLHSTLSVVEGITEFLKQGYSYRKEDLLSAEWNAKRFILRHQLFLSDRTGKVIDKKFLQLSYPGRWKYDILRALDHFHQAGEAWDDRMHPAIDVLLKKRRKDGRWNVQAKYPGRVHFDMEKAGQASRWNTLRVLRVFKHFLLEDLL